MALKSMIVRTVAAGAIALAIAAPAKADWSGLYIGVNAGWIGLSDANWQFDNGNTQTQQPGDSDNFIVGGHLGLQHQWGQLVVGVEASYSGTLSNRNDSTGLCVNAAFACDIAFRQLFTIGPRLGWAPNHQWLIYVTGGYAGAYIDSKETIIATNTPFDRGSAYHDGWFIGGGFEWKMHGNWILGLEYQHISLDSAQHISSAIPVPPGDNRHIEADADIVRVRLSYKLGRTEEAPLK